MDRPDDHVPYVTSGALPEPRRQRRSRTCSTGASRGTRWSPRAKRRRIRPGAFDFGTYTGDDEREVAARLYAHAPENLHDPDTGRWWITSCGWPGEPFQPVIPGSVAIRELGWE